MLDLSRVYADIITEKYFTIPPIQWGGRNLDNMTEMRKNYINTLRAADGGDLSLLLKLYAQNQ